MYFGYCGWVNAVVPRGTVRGINMKKFTIFYCDKENLYYIFKLFELETTTFLSTYIGKKRISKSNYFTFDSTEAY